MQPHANFIHQMASSLKNTNAPCPSQVVQQLENRQSRRFDIYRNNRAVSLVESLKAMYPVVYKLVGDDFFNAVARLYIDEYPPTSPVMAEYGGEFAQFLMTLPNTQSIAYIEDMAILEWSRLQAYHAKDAEVLAIDALSKVMPEEYETLCFKVHPSVRLLSSKWPIGGMWQAVVSGCNSDSKSNLDMNAAENIVIVRPLLDVSQHALTSHALMLVNKLVLGTPLVAAIEHVTETYPELNPGAELQSFIDLGVFESIYKVGNLSD